MVAASSTRCPRNRLQGAPGRRLDPLRDGTDPLTGNRGPDVRLPGDQRFLAPRRFWVVLLLAPSWPPKFDGGYRMDHGFMPLEVACQAHPLGPDLSRLDVKAAINRSMVSLPGHGL